MELFFRVPVFCLSSPYNYVSKIPKSKKSENIFNYFQTRFGVWKPEFLLTPASFQQKLVGFS